MALTLSNDTLVGALPFIKKLIDNQMPPDSQGQLSADNPQNVVPPGTEVNDFSQPSGSVLPFIRRQQQLGPMGPPVPPPEQDPGAQPPVLNVAGQDAPPAPPPQPPPDPMKDLSAAPAAAQGAPQLAGETKGHKLLRILTAGLQGGLNGVASNAQTYAQTGRNAGFGGGVYGSQMLPLQREALAGQNQHVAAETNLIGQQAKQLGQSVTIMTPNGPMVIPFALAKGALGASIGGQYKEGAATIGAKARTDAAQTGADARVKAAQMGLGPVADVPQDLQDQLGLPAKLPLKMLNTAESAANRPLTTLAGENDTFVVNKQTGEKRALGVGSPRIAAALARPVQIADADNPGETKFVSGGTAISTGAAGPQSASVQAPKAVAKKATSGNWADQKIAFNTAIQHAELLRDAAKALNNGDVRALSAISNQAKSQFGDPDLTNFQAIANAYNHEITSVISKGHITDNEVKSGDRTLPADANYQTIDKVLKSYQSLAQSKMTQLQKQIDEGMKGKTAKKSDPLGIL